MPDNQTVTPEVTTDEPTVNTEYILPSMKLMLGMEPDYNAFDTDLIIHINSALAKLSQVAVGPEGGFLLDPVAPETSKWEDFIGTDSARLHMAKTYVYLQLRILFDPPQNSFTQEMLKNEAEELLWRLNVEADPWDCNKKPNEGG